MARDRGPPSESVGGATRADVAWLGGRGLIIATQSNLLMTAIVSSTITSYIRLFTLSPTSDAAIELC